MSILPSGSRKVLRAQTEPTYDMGLGGDLPTDDQLRDFALTPHGDEDVQRAEDDQVLTNEPLPSDVSKEGDDSDVLQWVMKLMYDLGYQINEDLAKYANEFVKESIFTGPDGQLGERRVVITIPDRYGKAYKGGFLSGGGVKKRLSNRIITDIISDLRDQFDLFPVAGTGKEAAPIMREDGKLIINLSSNRPQPVVEEPDIEEEEPASELDELFGGGSGDPPTKRKKTNAKSASTLGKMMKKAWNNWRNDYYEPDRGASDEGYAKDEPSHKQALYFERLLGQAEKLGLQWNQKRDPYTFSKSELSELINMLRIEISKRKNK